MKNRLFFSLFFTLFFYPAFSQLQVNAGKLIIATVVKVIDGDTVDVMERDSIYRLRLFGIDAPENGQAYFKESREMLQKLILNKEVLLDVKDKDKYGRFVTIITRKTDKLNVNYQMVKSGMAWHFSKYSNDPMLEKLEVEAKAKEVGLWSQYNYLEPWEYRKSKH